MAARGKVVITDFVAGALDAEQRILGDLADVVAFAARHEDELAGHIEDADAVMMYHTIAITERTINALTRCRLIVRCGVGVDNVDHAAAGRRGIAVANVPDYGTEDVADTALAMGLALARGTHLLNSRLRRGEGAWSHTQAAPLRRLRGQTFVIIGLGRIGIAAAVRARAFGMRVAFFDPYVSEGMDKALGIERIESLPELLGLAHIVSMHCPLTAETHHLLSRKTIAQMRRGSFLVNTGRGALVDPDALLEALESGHLGGAGIDVLEQEPPDPNLPLVRAWRDPAHPAHDRLILTPHAAFYSEEGLMDMRVKGSENCRRALLGEPLRNVVNAAS